MNNPFKGARPRGSPSLAAFLSFLWPGLGQLYAGRRWVAAAFAIPAALVTLLALYQLRQGLTVFVARFVDPNYAFVALVLVLVVGLFRIAAIAHAYLAADRSQTGRRSQLAALSVILVLVVASHGVGAFATYSDYTAWSQVFGGSTIGEDANPSPAPGATANSQPIPTLEPAVTPAPGGRVTILLTGVDQYAGRSEHLYDSIMVVSIDRSSGKVAMVSVPRDSAGFPLYFGGQVTPNTKINSIVTYVQHGWIKSPDDPMTTFIKEVGFLVGVQINYYAILDLAGFMKLVDMVGGVDVNNPSLIDDPTYDWLDGVHHGFVLTAGRHHLDGKTALAYVRSRHGANNNDWKRESRQQQVLTALEHKMGSPDMMLRLPDFMQTVAKTIRTNYPAGDVADMIAWGETLPTQNITQVVLAPPKYTIGGTGTGGTYASCLRLDQIAALSVQLFGQDSRYYGKKQAATCP